MPVKGILVNTVMLIIFFNLFIWLCYVLLAACGI